MVSEDAPMVLSELRQHVSADDMPASAASAHKLKGMLSTFETAGPVLQLEELILSARKGKSNEVKAAMRSIENQIDNLLDEIVSLDKIA